MRYRTPRRRATALFRLAGPAAAVAVAVIPAAAGSTAAARTGPAAAATVTARRTVTPRPAWPGQASPAARPAYPVPGLAPGLSARSSLPPTGWSGPAATGPRYTLTAIATNLSGKPDTGAWVRGWPKPLPPARSPW